MSIDNCGNTTRQNSENEENLLNFTLFPQIAKKHGGSILGLDSDTEMKELADGKDFTIKKPDKLNLNNEIGLVSYN